MASIVKRGKTWQYTVSRMVNGKYSPIRKGGFKTKKEAQIAAAEVEAQLAKGVIPSLTPIVFAEYFETWIKTYKTDIAKNTLERYKTTLKTVQEYFGNTPIQKITKVDYQSFLNDYGKTHSKESTRKLNSHIRSCVKDAVDEGIIRSDFTRNAVLRGKAGKRPEEKFLNYEESKILLKELYNRLDQGLVYYLLLLGLTSGMRFAEMVGLTRKDFDFVNNTIDINKTWGYTSKMSEGFGPTKTAQSVRVIIMSPSVMEVFEDLFDKLPDNVHRLVFYNPISKYRVISNGHANNVLREVLDDLGLNIISLHGLRHTHASVLLFKKIDPQYVAERLGHDINTLYKTYAHVMKELRLRDEKQSAEIFEQMIVV